MRIDGAHVSRTSHASCFLRRLIPSVVCCLLTASATSQQAQPSIARIQQQFLSPLKIRSQWCDGGGLALPWKNQRSLENFSR